MPQFFTPRPAGSAGRPAGPVFYRQALVVLGVGLPALAAQAQAPNLSAPAQQRHPVLVNVKGGFNLSTYTGGGYIGWNTYLKGGFSGGFLATRSLSARSAWQVELLYLRKGAVAYDYWHIYSSAAPPTAPKENIYRSELHYLDLPVLFTYGPGSGSRMGWYVAAGPQLSLAFDKQETVVPDGSNSDSYQETLNGDAKSLTRLGGGYVVGVGRQWTNYGIELRYSGDFTNVYRDGYGSGALYAGSGNRFHNGVLQLQVNLALRGVEWVNELGRPGYTPTHTPDAPTPETRVEPQRPPTPPQSRPRP